MIAIEPGAVVIVETQELSYDGVLVDIDERFVVVHLEEPRTHGNPKIIRDVMIPMTRVAAIRWQHDDEPKSREEKLSRLVEALDLGARANGHLHEAGITCLGDLTKLTRDEILKFPGIGRTSCKVIDETLKELGLSLRTNVVNLSGPISPPPITDHAPVAEPQYKPERGPRPSLCFSFDKAAGDWYVQYCHMPESGGKHLYGRSNDNALELLCSYRDYGGTMPPCFTVSIADTALEAERARNRHLGIPNECPACDGTGKEQTRYEK